METSYIHTKEIELNRVQRSDFERQIFILCKRDAEIREVVKEAYNHYCFIYKEAKGRYAAFGMRYCEQILKNDDALYPFKDLPKKLGEPASSFYIYRRDVLNKLFSMLKDKSLI